MRYCGFSEFMHDAGLAFISEDGRIEFATHGERYSKFKNDPLLPDECWEMIRNGDHVTFYENPDIRLNIEFYKGGKKNSNTWKDSIIYSSLDYDDFCEHHIAHAANGLYTRPWESLEDTVIVSIDGAGEEESTVIFDHNFNILDKWCLPRSLGYMYGYATKILGLRILEEEYIVMGMAAYGEPTVFKEMKDFFYSLPYEEFDIRNQGSPPKANYRKFLKGLRNRSKKEDFAASIQKLAEYVMVERCQFARRFGSKLILTGGCAQNIVAASLIKPMFDDMWIPVAPSDSGSALGAAAYTYCKQNGVDRIKWEDPYLGYDIKRDINPKEVVKHLLEHTFCGVANGRAEFGPRALGNRSLIADVRYPIRDTVNSIKRRQKFRPFAPAVLEEFAGEYFEGPMNEYMQYVSKAKHDYSSVIHVDGTSRVQIVRKDCKSVIRQILEEYYEQTGVPMLLNTSLNIKRMPIVNDEFDANQFQSLYGVKVF